LPATTLACWARSCDAREIQSVLGPAGPADHESLIGVFLSVLVSDEQERRQLTEDIGPRVVFVVGQGKRSGDSGMALPSMGLLVESKGGQRLVEHLDRAVDLFTAFLAAVSGSTTRPDGETYIVRREVEGVELHYAPIGPMLTRRLKAPILASLEPCWAIVGDRMCMSTSSAHIAEIVRALRGSGSRLEVSGEMARPEAGATEWIYIQGKALSQVGTNLLRHLETTQPAMLRATWWQAWAEARLAKRERLGLSIKPESRTQRTARVEHVDVDSPAQGLLTAGDVIVAVGGRSLATAEPAREVAEAYARRKAGESFVLTVRRGADTLDVQIPTRAPIDVDLRDFDPIAALRRLTLLLSRVETLTISGRSTRSDRLDSQIVIRWDPSLSKPAPPGPPSDQ
jgi:hypothetical protein